MAYFVANKAKKRTYLIFISTSINRFFDFNGKAALVIRGALCHLLGRKLIVFHNFVITIAKHITNFLKRIKDRKRTT